MPVESRLSITLASNTPSKLEMMCGDEAVEPQSSLCECAVVNLCQDGVLDVVFPRSH
jgi:hypothetical protein